MKTLSPELQRVADLAGGLESMLQKLEGFPEEVSLASAADHFEELVRRIREAMPQEKTTSKGGAVFRVLDVGYVKGPPALKRRAKATLFIRLDRLGKLAYRAESSTRGRAQCAGGAIEMRLDTVNPIAGEGTLGNVVWEYPAK